MANSASSLVMSSLNPKCDDAWAAVRTELETRRVEIVLGRAPISLQGSSASRRDLTAAVRSLLAHKKFVLVDDVEVQIEWTVGERDRYESVGTPDVDNIVKPILDALKGPTGIILDDCQVHSVSCWWVDGHSTTQSARVVVTWIDGDAWLLKDGLVLVDLGTGLCLPWVLNDETRPRATRLLEFQVQRLRDRQALLEAGSPWHEAQSVMSIQRFFHRSRVREFRVVSVADFGVVPFSR